MEVNERFLTLLTPEGEFLRARKQDKQYSLGEEIHFFPLEVNQKVKDRFFSFDRLSRKTIAFSTAAALLFFSVLIPLNSDPKVYAYMSIDVNPSIELGINKELKVIELNAYNEEGKEIIDDITGWKNKDMTVITDKILNEVKEQGYFEKNHDILISTVPTDVSESDIDVQMDEKVEEIQQHIDESITLTVMEATEKERNKAKKLGLSTGKYKSEKQGKIHVIEKKQKIISPKKDKKQDTNLTPTPKVTVPPVKDTVPAEKPVKEQHPNAHVPKTNNGQGQKHEESGNKRTEWKDDKQEKHNQGNMKNDKKQHQKSSTNYQPRPNDKRIDSNQVNNSGKKSWNTQVDRNNKHKEKSGY
ncbi:anti-sigma factor domain-containing protein [Bacillus sp. cl95]|uniref:anti-sigma factor domain-containing protein n=2 Tax=unclassified Bacillus (in: firmicutes) TaxID=185979 RepID=UPI0008E894DD|nr:anti-sigma factor domain-containing protein [Bacillus sp. cl95]SFA77489.1 Anti-sigma factor N-terminus [Bacillus sp. UNCCL13]SFQ67422.1 Anti-sigma factor N-terminus [Bacillus sp. cl95]